MPDSDSGEKTEEPTAKRRQDAREEGNIPRSAEVNSVFVLLAAVIYLRFGFPLLYQTMNDATLLAIRAITPGMARNFDLKIIQPLWNESLVLFFKGMLPVSLTILFFGLVSNLLQVGFLFTTKPLQPKWSKINPISGAQRLLSLRAVVDTLKNVIKLLVVCVVSYVTIEDRFAESLRVGNETVAGISVYMLLLIYDVSIRIILTLAIIAILDYAYQRYENEKKMKMSRQEIKDEHKMQEGNPQVKGRIRQLQREMSRRRMMENVPKATVVVTNPTHLSIAIQYDQETMDTPIVVAKGADNIAMKIREVAQEHHIPLYEDVSLARAMYDKVEPGDEIPVEFFNAVAEILAYIYRLQTD